VLIEVLGKAEINFGAVARGERTAFSGT